MIQRLNVINFKAFDRFRLDISGDAFLAGPNNAGKSTLITALRISAQMLRIAMRRNPAETFQDGAEQVLGYSFTNTQVSLVDENLRHEMRDVESRLRVRFRGGGALTAVWPSAESEEPPFFYLQQGRLSVNNVRQARDAFTEIVIVPVLSPLDLEEESLTPKYVGENLDGRLASRHFRNQLALLNEPKSEDDLKGFLDFARPWLPELRIRALGSHMGEKNMILDLYYTEVGRRAEKEIA